MDEMTLLRDLLESDPGPSAATDATVGIALSKVYETAESGEVGSATKDDGGRTRADSSQIMRPRRVLRKRLLLAAATVILVATGLVVAGIHTSSTPAGSRLGTRRAPLPLVACHRTHRTQWAGSWSTTSSVRVGSRIRLDRLRATSTAPRCPLVSRCQALTHQLRAAHRSSQSRSTCLRISDRVGRFCRCLPGSTRRRICHARRR